MRTKPHRKIKAWAKFVASPNIGGDEPRLAVISKRHPNGIFPGVFIGDVPVMRESDFS
jgi:hypothetical protein